MNYIVFDLEWNQASTKDKEVKGIMFEILEIGAVKLDEGFNVTDTFSSLVRPQVYMTMHSMTRRILHLNLKAMKEERPFPEVAGDFLSWCGPDPMFCTWGPSDLTELARNMRYYRMEPLSAGPLPYLDVQKLYSLKCDDGKTRSGLENAVDAIREKYGEIGNGSREDDFHTALGDAQYTAEVFARIADPYILRFKSYDTFVLPSSRSGEIHTFFPTYFKYVSRGFKNKGALLSDLEVCTQYCCECRKRVKRVVKWFSPNGGRYYLSISKCQSHGYHKGKLRIKKHDSGRCYAVKTIKPISEEQALAIKEKYRDAIHRQKRNN